VSSRSTFGLRRPPNDPDDVRQQSGARPESPKISVR
jgi:hypothetical protein